MPRSIAALTATTACLAALALPAAAVADVRVDAGSPATPFPQNKQNEPTVAIDPAHPNVVAAGSNDELDLAPCDGSSCPFTPGVGVSGVYLSFDGGGSWTQPTYQGFSARDGSPGPGPIGTLPNYAEHGLVSDGDPAIVFGPRPDANGGFSWSNGSRLYYANLTSNFSTERSEQAFRGFEAIAVSHADDLRRAASGANDAWSDPAIVTAARQSATTFSDKEDVWADNAASSPHFGTLYVCYTQFRSNGSGPEPIAVSRSSDGGVSFARPRQISAATNTAQTGGRQGCAVRTDSRGTVYVFYEGAGAQMLARSFDGGATFERPRPVASVVDVGASDPASGDLVFDGVAGARTGSFPTVSIANGAPSGAGASDTIALGWADAGNGLDHEQALVSISTDRGESFGDPVDVAQAGDRPDFPALALSPDGGDLYVAYDAFLDPFQATTAAPRRFEGVVRHAGLSGGALGAVTTLERGAVGDARASSANALSGEFLGDYNDVDATNGSFGAVYNDARDGADCPAIDAFRQALADGEASPAIPAPASDCAPTFGETDIYGQFGPDPTP